MNSRRRSRISELISLVAFASCLATQAAVTTNPAAKNGIEVKMVFPGLNQNLFDRKYGNATLSAVAVAAGVPKEYVTWVSRPQTAAAPAAVPISAAAAVAATSSKAPAAIAAPTASEAAAAKPAAVAASSSTTPAAAAAPTASEAAAAPTARTPAAAPLSSTAAVATTPAVAAANNGSKGGDTASGGEVDAAQAAAAAAPTAGAATAATNTTAANTTTATRANASTAITAAAAPLTETQPAAAAPTPSPAERSSSNVSLLSGSSTKASSTKGARRLLAPAAAAAAAAAAAEPDQSGATAIYRISTTPQAWATPEAITRKLQTASAPPGYTFLTNLARVGVPYEPTVYLNGAMILEGRPAFSGSPRQVPVAVASSNDVMRGEKPADAMYGPLPQWVFIAIVVLAGLVAVLLIVGTCVGIWLAVRACARHRRRQEEERERGQFIKSDNSSDSGSSSLTPAPGGGVVPTQGALEQLNASFPSATGSKSPRSVASDVKSIHTVHTTATTARSNIGLVAAPDGKNVGGKIERSQKYGRSKIPESDDVEFYRQCLRDGKPVPILPHSRIVKPLTSSIKVPMTPTRANADAANASPAEVQEQQQ